MAKEANPTAVGGFVLGAAGIAIVGLLTFGSLGFTKNEFRMVAYFESSVSGLDIGAPVRFQGVQVGSVCAINAVWDSESEEVHIPVELILVEGSVQAADPSEMDWEGVEERIENSVQRGLRAELRQDSFVTGKLFVALVDAPDSPIRRISDGSMFEMPTREGGFERLAKSIEDLPIERLVDSAINAIEAIEALASDPEIPRLMRRLSTVAEDLDGTIQPTIRDFNQLITKIDSEFGGLARDFQRLAQSADKLVLNADTQIGTLALSANTTMERAQGSLAELDTLLQGINAEVGPLANTANATMTEVRDTVGHLDGLVGRDPTVVYRIGALLEDMTAAARSVRALADYLERHPEALISGKD